MRVSQDVISGMTEEESRATLTTDKPMMVFVYDADVDEQRYLVEENKVFFDDKVAIGARFFDCLRIDLDSARDDRALAKKVKRAPMLVFLRPNYQVHKVLTGRFNAGKIFQAMCSTTRQDYKACVKSALRTQKLLSKERVKLDRQWVKLEQLNTKIADEGSQRKRAKLIKDRDALNEKLSAAEVKIDEREAKLYVLTPKTAP